MLDADAPVNCENCGTPLDGAYCHACGQHAVNPLRNFAHAFEELFESFWHLDGRAFRTFRDLLVPGRVACNYLAGQRARYIPPLRLFLVLTVVTFFVGQFVVNAGGDASAEKPGTGSDIVQIDTDGVSDFAKARTPAEVIALREQNLVAIRRMRHKAEFVPGTGAVFDKAEAQLRTKADARLVQLGAAGSAPLTTVTATRRAESAKPASAPPSETTGSAPDGTAPAQRGPQSSVAKDAPAPAGAGLTLPDGKPSTAAPALPGSPAASAAPADKTTTPDREARREDLHVAIQRFAHWISHDRLRDAHAPWDEYANPLDINWLPNIGDHWINHRLANAERNMAQIDAKGDAGLVLLFSLALAALPSALFVLVPVFALLLRVLYLFSRRGYLEHLVVALYSHAFMLLALLTGFVLSLLGLAGAGHAAATVPVTLLTVVLWISVPAYLFEMQRRVYGQHWALTLLKYFALGLAYFILVGVAVIYTAFAGITSSG